MTLTQLTYFISIAKYLSFRKAAEENYITQSALSRSMAALENELHCKLFVRTTRSVQLTREGMAVLADAKKIIRSCDNMISKARILSESNANSINIGYFHNSSFYEFYKKAKILEDQYFLETESATISDLISQFNNQDLDIVIVPESVVHSLAGASYRRLMENHYYAVVHKSHPLAMQQEIEASALVNYPFVVLDEQRSPQANRVLHAIGAKYQFQPNIVATALKANDAAMIAKQLNAVTLMTGYVFQTLPSEFRKVRIMGNGIESWTVYAWHTDSSKPFIDTIRQLT